jgi:hypothetical protein
MTASATPGTRVRTLRRHLLLLAATGPDSVAELLTAAAHGT